MRSAEQEMFAVENE